MKKPMKKTLAVLALGAAGAMAIPSAFAQSAPNDSGYWFINGNVGRAHLDKNHYNGHDTGYAGNFGYRWLVSRNAALGVEAGYNDLGNIHLNNAFNDKNVVSNGRSSLHGWTAGVDGHFNLNPNWYISARTGVYGWSGHGVSNDSNPLAQSVSKTDWYGGAGVGYDFASNWSLGLKYDYYHASKDNVDLSTDMVSVGAEYRF